MAKISLKVNGKSHTVDVEPDMPLLYALRNDLQLNGPKFGCGLAQCGACTVLMDGNAIRSCVTPVSGAQNKQVTTLEGLGTTKKLHRIQQAFVDEQAAQCGYCINGMIMTSKALLDKNPKPTDTPDQGSASRQSLPLRHAYENPARGQTGIGAIGIRKERSDENHGTYSQTISQSHRRADCQLQPVSLLAVRFSRNQLLTERRPRS